MSDIRFNLRERCPACESRNFYKITEIEYNDPKMLSYLSKSYRLDPSDFESIAEGSYYRILQCQACSLLFQGYVPSESFLTVIYDDYIDPSNSLLKKTLTKEHSRLYQGDFALIRKLLGKASSDIRILDYAAGWGNWISLAYNSGFKTYALELSEHRKSHLASIGIQVVDESQLANLSMDFVNCDQIFEHLIDPIVVLKSIRKSLNENGLVRILVPHSFFPDREVSLLDRSISNGFKIPDILAPLEHLNYFEKKSLRALAHSAGFELVEVSLLKYISSSNYGGAGMKELLKTIIRPYYRRYFSNIVFLRKSS